MTHDTLVEERWVELDDFPGYSVSDIGRVFNIKTEVYISPTRNPRGILMVGLTKDRVQYKRSLAVLVARSYLPRETLDSFDTVIHLDGDRFNVHYMNLAWRPLWFARKYMRQFLDRHVTYDAPIEDVETRCLYKNSMHAASTHGLLDTEIVLSMHNNGYVWPTGQIFRKAVNF